MIAWMMRALVVAGLASAAAYCFERALYNRGQATRFAWLFGIATSLLLPLVPRLARVPDVSGVIPAIQLPAIVITAPGAAPIGALALVMLLWVLLSALALVVYGVALARLHSARREWRGAVLAQHDVLVSQTYGPAVCGFRRPRIVVPAWIFDIGALEQRLVVLHEAEHIRARDHLLVLFALVATIVMPWNPFVWLQIRRMRFAVEADCDQRVLSSTGDRQQYASLLVDVGRRHSGLMLSPALAEQRHGLEERLAIMARSVVRKRWSALAFALGGALLVFVACESRLPMAAPQRAADQAVTSKEAPKQPWIFGEAEYPPVLRAAGIGGTVSLRIHVTD
ncbi:MAG TPA: M56 family metallopeptidase, partial [Longimicrobiales bacterium]